MDEKEIEYLQSLLKIPSVGARGVNAIYDEVKKQGKALPNMTSRRARRQNPTAGKSLRGKEVGGECCT